MSPMQVGPYEVLEEVARGGMGVVYLARDSRTGDQVALKLLLAAHASDEQRRRFAREAQALRRLDVPGVVRLRDVGEVQGRPYLALDWVPGRSLQDRLDTQGVLSSREAAALVAKLGHVLQQAHQLGIVHRDLKPANVLLGEQGQPILTDFGLVKDLDSNSGSLSKTGVFMGTPGYWPPEQAAGDLKRIGPAGDIYGLGATLYALLTRTPPITGATLAEVATATLDIKPQRPSAAQPGVDSRLDPICMRCLEKDPEARYPSALAVSEALEAFLRTAPTRRNSPWPMLAVGGAALLAAGLSATWASQREVEGPVVGASVAATRSTPAPDPLARVRALQDAGGWAESLPLLEACLDQIPDDPEALYRRGDAHWEAENAVHSLLDWGRAAEGEGEWAIAGALRLGDVLIEVQSFPAAIRQLSRAIELQPGHVQAHRSRAEAYYQNRDFDAALSDCGWLLSRNPDDVDALWRRGRIHVQTRTLGEAAADLNRALELDPGHTGSLHERISLSLFTGDFELGRIDATRLIELDPRDGRAWSSLATVRLNMNDLEGTIEAADQAISLDPANSQGWLARGLAHQTLGRLAEALRDLNRAVELNGSGEIHSIRADLRRALGDEEGWESDIERARDLFPEGSERRRQIEEQLGDRPRR